MSRVLVDANVLLDVLTQDRVWADWSGRQLRAARQDGLLSINPIVYAELAPAFPTATAHDAFFDTETFDRLALPYEAGWLAGQAYARYRNSGGTRAAPLPDFYIGAHAQIAGLDLLTRDARRYRSYFPSVSLITP